MREELNEYLLAFVLTAVLLWYTYVSIPRSPARAARRPLPDAEEQGAGVGRARAAEPESDAQSDEDLDWPEFIYP